MRKKSYREQYNRMLRRFDDLKAIYADYNAPWKVKIQKMDSGITRTKFFIDSFGADELYDYNMKYKERGIDTIYTFFQNCFHLKDWMKEDSDIRILVSSKDIEDFVNQDSYLTICADLCNGSKHSRLKYNIRQDKDTDVEATCYVLRQEEDLEELSVSGAFLVICSGREYDALELAKSCIERWDDFIAKYGLPLD